ncbi:MAG: sensor histidine kinase [Flavisolibacter sp.]
MNLFISGLTTVSLLFLAAGGMAQEPTIISRTDELVHLAPHAAYYEDPKGLLRFEEIQKEEAAGRFRELDKPVINFGISASAYWLKLDLENATDERIFLEIGNTALNDIQLYEPSGRNGVIDHHAGSWQPFRDRELQHVDYIFPLSLPRGARQVLYLRVQHARGTQFPLLAGTLKAFYKTAGTRNVMEGIYYGFMLLMILYNLFIFFSLRDRSYIYYVIYIFMMGLLNASINGYAFRYFWPSLPVFNQYEDIIAALVGISGILFATAFLNTRVNAPYFHRLFRMLLVCYLLIIGIVVTGRFMLGTILVELTSLILVLSFFAAAWQTLTRGYKPARFFLIAWTLLLLSVIVFILKDFDILPYNSFTVSSMQIGSAIEAVLLSLALANKINVYKKEKHQAQLETLRSLEENRKLITEQNVLLEKKVAERTGEWQSANRELIRAMDNLKATQAQLLQKEKMASLGELTAGIAHEIQNPLNFVNNFSEINVELSREILEEISRLEIEASDKNNLEELIHSLVENEAKINRHGKRADSIVKGMLQHSRSQTGTKEFFDINTLADEYLRLSYHGLKARDKNFQSLYETDLDQSIGKLHIVPQDMGRVLLNLFNNAFYSVNEKKKILNSSFQPRVQLQTKRMEDRVEIRIRDNGSGIPTRVIDKIFQPFFTTKPTGEGTGLGLSLSYDIITKVHHGEMKVNTHEGEFAEFIIVLPLNPK